MESEADLKVPPPRPASGLVLTTSAVPVARRAQLGEQERRIRPGARLVTSGRGHCVCDFGRIEIAFRVDAQAMDAPHAAGEIAPGLPTCTSSPLAVVPDHLRRAAVGRPDVPRAVHDDQVDVRGRLADAPHPQELAVFVEHLDPPVVPIVDEDFVRDRIDRDAVHAVEVARARFRLLRGTLALLAPRHHVVVVLVVLTTRVLA